MMICELSEHRPEEEEEERDENKSFNNATILK